MIVMAALCGDTLMYLSAEQQYPSFRLDRISCSSSYHSPALYLDAIAILLKLGVHKLIEFSFWCRGADDD